MKHRKDFDETDKLLIATQYTRLTDSELAERIGTSRHTVRRYRHANGLHITEKQFARKMARKTSPPRVSGEEHYRYSPPGTVSISYIRGVPAYAKIKLESGKWVRANRHIYEQANGPIPAGYVVRSSLPIEHPDHSRLENLYIMPRAEMAADNGRKSECDPKHMVAGRQRKRMLDRLKKSL